MIEFQGARVHFSDDYYLDFTNDEFIVFISYVLGMNELTYIQPLSDVEERND